MYSISGQGADEIFAGYPIFVADYLRESDNAFPIPNLSESSRKAEQLLAEKSSRQSFPVGSRAISTTARRILGNTLTPALMTSAFPNLPFKPSLFPQNQDRLPDPQFAYSEGISPKVLEQMRAEWHPLHTAQYIFCKGHLDNLLLSNLVIEARWHTASRVERHSLIII